MVKCKCGKIPTFGLPNDIRPSCCKSCKSETMVDIHHKKCPCGKIPYFGLPSDKRPSCCKSCKLENMVDIKSKKCKCGSGKQPAFGLIDDKSPSCCSVCKLENMVDIKNKNKCPCGSGKRPTFGVMADKRPSCCGKCKLENMVDIKNKNKCPCGKRPTFGLPNDIRPSCCGKCKSETMVDINNKKCPCGKQPYFGLIGDKSPSCCSNCKLENMIDIVTKKCISSHCNLMPYNTKKHDGYCTHCFKNMFPDDPRTLVIRTKSKELLVKQFLSENHTGFIHDNVLETRHCDCSHRRRIDFRMLINNTLLCVEVDENQHSSYMTDEIRYNDLYMSFSGKFIFIRFNPDNYRIDGVLKKTQMKTRLNSLSGEINKHITRIEQEDNTELLEIHKLYYTI